MMSDNEFQGELEQLCQEKDALNNSIALNKILHGLIIESKREKFRLWVVILGLIAVIITGIIGFFAYESQFEIVETTKETITETSADTTYSYAEASGENASINNVQGDQYNDQATRNNYYKDGE